MYVKYKNGKIIAEHLVLMQQNHQYDVIVHLINKTKVHSSSPMKMALIILAKNVDIDLFNSTVYTEDLPPAVYISFTIFKLSAFL